MFVNHVRGSITSGSPNLAVLAGLPNEAYLGQKSMFQLQSTSSFQQTERYARLLLKLRFVCCYFVLLDLIYDVISWSSCVTATRTRC